MPSHHCIVIPWLKAIGQRFIFPTWLAITIGPLIFSWRPLDDVELAHELQHVRQWRANGLAYIPRYLAASNAAAKAGKDRYWDNAFELDARAAADKVRAARAAAGGSTPNGSPG
jgi:hypothetical protein